MYVEMELLARERYERRLREAEEFRLHRALVGPQHSPAQGGRRVHLPRLRQK